MRCYRKTRDRKGRQSHVWKYVLRMHNLVEPFSPEVTKSCDRKRPCLEAVLTRSSSTVITWLPDVTGVPLGVRNTRSDLGVFSRTFVFYYLFLTLAIYTFPRHFIFIITLFIPIIAFLTNVCHHHHHNHHLSRMSASYYRFLALSLVIFPPFYFHNYIIYLGGGGGRVEEEGGKEEVSFDAYQPRHRRRGNGFPGSR